MDDQAGLLPAAVQSVRLTRTTYKWVVVTEAGFVARLDNAGETMSYDARCAGERKSARAYTAYLHLGTPSFTHNPDLTVILLFGAETSLFSRGHEASPASGFSIGPFSGPQDPRE